MLLIIDSQLFPCIDFIKTLVKFKYVKIEKYEHFKKMSFRNRFVIAGANGVANLTIPVIGGREQKTLFTEIEIDRSNNWPTKHWRSIASAYSKAPFFDYYAEEVKHMIFNPQVSLFDFNLFILIRICKLLNISPSIDFTEHYFISGTGEDEGKLDFRNRFLPRNFQEKRENWRPKYSQVFEDRLGFQPNLSILDLLFCEGPNSLNLLIESINT